MRILFAAPDDDDDVGAWSGTNYYMRRALERVGATVVSVSPLRTARELPVRLAARFATKAAGRVVLADREPVVLRAWASRIQAVASRGPRCDVLFAPSSLPVAYFPSAMPVAFWTDATFALLAGYYPEWRNVSKRSARLGDRAEARALHRSAAALYTSEWAANSAIRDYKKPESDVHVVPFGANVADPGEIDRSAGRRKECRLLVVGKDWERKGIDIAVATVEALRRRQITAVLDVVGARPTDASGLPPWINVHGALRKDVPDEANRLDRLYREASFFVLPTRADCTPVVLAEAQAYSLPVVTSDTGGVPSMVFRGAGTTLPLDGFPAHAAAYVDSSWNDDSAYRSQCRSARRAYQSRLNWDVSATRVLGILDALLSRSP